MKRLILIICFCLSLYELTNAQGQIQDNSTATLQETVDWINSKLKIYNKTDIYDVSISVSNCELDIHFSSKVRCECDNGEKYINGDTKYEYPRIIYNYDVKIPIAEIKEIPSDSILSMGRYNLNEFLIITQSNQIQTFYEIYDDPLNKMKADCQTLDCEIGDSPSPYSNTFMFCTLEGYGYNFQSTPILDLTREDNLRQRMINAFNHLRKFCQKPVSHEKF